MVDNGTFAATALARATSTIPIVASMGDPVGEGLAKTLAKPGGNVTGVALASPEIYAKTFDLLKAIIPGSWGLAFVEGELAQHAGSLARAVEAGARLSAVPVHRMRFVGRSAAEVDRLLAALPARGIRAISAWGPIPGHPEDEFEWLTRYGLVHVPSSEESVARGALLAYDAEGDEGRQAAQLAMILRGTPPGEIPFELASRFRLVINAKAARALGFTVPPSMLMRADMVYE
jgi:putative ABC transport system substrate-binding protein